MIAENRTREEKAQLILKDEKAITRVDAQRYVVKSQSGNGQYEVIISQDFGWACSCADHMYRAQECKHILAVKFSLELRKKVESQIIITPVAMGNCPRCKSENVVRNGIRKNKSGSIQRYLCCECGKWFTLNMGFEKMHATPQMITGAMQLYFSGESLRNVQKFLKLQGVKKSHVSVYNWIKRYVGLMDKYLGQITPQVSGTWRTDELFLKVKGNTKYLYALMDDETRFWIAQQVADNKFTENVRPLFAEGKRITGKKPDVLISDGAMNFHEAYQQELWSRVAPRTSHIRHIHLKGDHNNNKMERLNGELRDREKVMRSLKKTDSVMIKGMQDYHNYFRENMGLDGKTPAEAANIKISGPNKWITVIQNAVSQN